jgi:mannose-6-phosphate isomerase-like protein (cupin superfamily)
MRYFVYGSKKEQEKMSEFTEIQAKGLSGCWIAASLDPEKLHLHITEIPAGARAHPLHNHDGAEAFYVLEGSGVIETRGETVPVGANQAVILDASHLHGLINTGDRPMKYVVIIAKP